jgi:hypothetical protein
VHQEAVHYLLALVQASASANKREKEEKSKDDKPGLLFQKATGFRKLKSSKSVKS